MTQLVRTHVDTPLGRLGLVADDEALVAVLFDADGPYADDFTHDPADADIDVDAIAVVAPDEQPVLAAAASQLGEYFEGQRRVFELPLRLVGTDFQRAAWSVLSTIPFGETLTYGEQAMRMGDRNKARAVGAANGKNRIPIVIPCHRVVGSNGALTGFAGGVGVKEWLLRHEGDQMRLALE